RTENGVKVNTIVMGGEEGRPMTLGKQVRAYRPDGKEADAAAVLKALKEPGPVACFTRGQQAPTDKPQAPDAFYLKVLREDGIALVFDMRDAAPERQPLFPSGGTPPVRR